MVKLETLQKEIDSIHENYKNHNKDSTEGNRARRRLAKITPIRDYLANNPSESYLRKDKARIENRMQALDEQFDKLHPHGDTKVEYQRICARKEYDKLNDVATLKRHLGNINYILTN